MGSDGGIRYIPYTTETLYTKLLELLKEWLCSEDKCPYDFDGLIYVENDKIMIVPDEDNHRLPIERKAEA